MIAFIIVGLIVVAGAVYVLTKKPTFAAPVANQTPAIPAPASGGGTFKD